MHPQMNAYNIMTHDRNVMADMANAAANQGYQLLMARGLAQMLEPKLARAQRLAAEVRSRHSAMQVQRIIPR
jgi:hypothetical protein